MTDKTDDADDSAADAAASAAGDATPAAAQAGAIPPPPPPPVTEPIAAPPTTPLTGHQVPPLGAPPKNNWWRDHLWTTVIGASLLTGIAGLAVGFAIAYFGTSGHDGDRHHGPGYHHGKRWDDRGRHHGRHDRDDWYDRWGPDRGPGGRDGDWGRGYWDDRGPGGRGNEQPPWMRTPRPTPGQQPQP
ncbi:MAG TPA: hypothetical protein PKG94_03830, partial [Gordonia sp. (in: high G+C Gram-positive bacteria)]|nr:hypothetical protein [Gordonia sp. (in: high G+C Gram-positive bacteria)]